MSTHMNIRPPTHDNIRFPNFNIAFSHIQTKTGKHKNCLEDYVGTNKSIDLWLLNEEMKEQSQRSQLARSTTAFSSLSSGGQETEAGRSTHRETAVSRFKKKPFQQPSNRICPWKKKNCCSGQGWRRWRRNILFTLSVHRPNPHPHPLAFLFLRSPSRPGSVYSGGHPILLPTSLGPWVSAQWGKDTKFLHFVLLFSLLKTEKY